MKKSVVSTVLVTVTSIVCYTHQTFAINCAVPPTCEEMGYTHLAGQCPGNYIACPFDTAKGICDYVAQPGEIAFFTENPGKGWLLCDGTWHPEDKYPDLKGKLNSAYSKGRFFQVPDYQGDFLRVAGGNSLGVGVRQAEGLPNIKGSFYGDNVSRDINIVATGAFSKNAGYGSFSISTYSDRLKNGFNFDASYSNPIYGASEHVTPVNSAVYAYMFVGREVEGVNNGLANCSVGDFLYSDYTCSSSYNSDNTLKGIISSKDEPSADHIRLGYVHRSYLFEGYTAAEAEELCATESGTVATYDAWKYVPFDANNLNYEDQLTIGEKHGWFWSGLSEQYLCDKRTESCTKGKTLHGKALTFCNYYILITK